MCRMIQSAHERIVIHRFRTSLCIYENGSLGLSRFYFSGFFYLYLIVLSRKKSIQWQSQTLFLKTILSFLKSSDDFSSLVPAQVISSGWKFPGPRSAQKAETFLLWPTERRRVLLRSLQTKCRDRSVIERSVADSTQQKRQLTF